MRRVAVAITVALLLTSCTVRLPPRADPTPTAPAVDWSQYDETVQQRIDTLAADADCSGLQDEFDIAEANGSDERVQLMSYIDYQMRDTGCYNDE